jgi:C-terminal processing protease CtpA/Prc
MPRKATFLTLAIGICLLVVYPLPSMAREDTSRVLTFEAAGTTSPLSEWNGKPLGPPGTLFLDSTVVYEGRYSGRIELVAGSPSEFSSFALEIPIDFSGDTLELRGWMKYENVTGYVGLWQRQDGKAGMVAFDNMAERGIKGTADWTEYRVSLPLMPKARKASVGALLASQGKLWVDDLRLYVDGKPLAEAPALVRTPTPLDTDHEFDAGSRAEIARLAPGQVENLVLLGKVWGFLKYHHPAVIAGKRHWDYDLFRALPAVIAARDRGAGKKAIAAWVAALGEAPPCTSCVETPKGRPILPRLGWLSDRKLLGGDLSERLVTIYTRRPKVDEQFYVAKVPMIGNPDFSNEMGYAGLKEPDAGYRLLSLYRFWNMIEYWFPYRDLLDEDWDVVLREFVPRLAAARTRDDYAAAMMALIARAHDTHANLWGSLEVRPPRGKAQVPVRLRFIEDQAVVTGYAHATLGPASGLRIGDAIRAIEGVSVDTLIARWRPMYAASNEASRLRDMAGALTRGQPSPARLAVKREGSTLDVSAARVPLDSLDMKSGWTHDLPGPTCRRLSDDIAYLKLSSVKTAEVADYLRGAAGARCLVIDIRNYPSEFVVFDLGQHLVNDSTAFVVFTSGDTSNPGAFDWTKPLSLTPEKPYFEGGVAILVDEVSQSQAEYTTMAFRARPGSVVVGSTTAGADGNLSPISLPGGLRTGISGIGVFYPDRRPTQRVGIVPDVVVRPTIAGIRAGRDEVMEAAIRRVLGRQITDSERTAMGIDHPRMNAVRPR